MAVGEPGPIRAGPDAPFGESAALARMASPQPAPAGQPGAGARPASAAPAAPVAPPNAPNLPEMNGGYDAALFGPTDRPQEPVTSGAQFGPGANFTQNPQETSRQFMLRVADQLAVTPELAAYVGRIRSGA
jgi:hypothetical protein